jgi:hypothetical protein
MMPRSEMLAGVCPVRFTRDRRRCGVRSHQHRPLHEVRNRAGIDPPASFHILCRMYATDPQAGAPLPAIAANLRH